MELGFKKFIYKKHVNASGNAYLKSNDKIA